MSEVNEEKLWLFSTFGLLIGVEFFMIHLLDPCSKQGPTSVMRFSPKGKMSARAGARPV
jgi:hypothetical protein